MCSRIPWVVMHSSAISASRKDRERILAFCFIGMTMQPWPVTIRNCAASSPPRDPETTRASFGAGTIQKSTMSPYVMSRG